MRVITSQDLETKTQAARLLGLLDLGEPPEAQSVHCASVSIFHLCHTPQQCCFLTVLLMLLNKVRDASRVTDIKIRNLFFDHVLLRQ